MKYSTNLTRRSAYCVAAVCITGLLILAGCASSQNQQPIPAETPAPQTQKTQSTPEHAAHMPQAEQVPAAAETPRIPAHHMNLDEARPLAATLDPAQFSTPYVLRAYRVAKRIPEVLALQPCYCYCDGSGHTSLLDCYATDHGANCHVCVKEALLADKMQREGHSAEDIRNAIIRGEWNEVSLN